MPAIGIGLGWIAYTAALWGYCLIRGYNVTLTQLVNPVSPVTWKQATAGQVPQGQIMPSASSSGTVGQGTAGPVTIPGGGPYTPPAAV
jgi:hypothetical protein